MTVKDLIKILQLHDQDKTVIARIVEYVDSDYKGIEKICCDCNVEKDNVYVEGDNVIIGE